MRKALMLSVLAGFLTGSAWAHEEPPSCCETLEVKKMLSQAVVECFQGLKDGLHDSYAAKLCVHIMTDCGLVKE